MKNAIVAEYISILKFILFVDPCCVISSRNGCTDIKVFHDLYTLQQEIIS